MREGVCEYMGGQENMWVSDWINSEHKSVSK